MTCLRVFRAVFSALNIVKIESNTALRNVYKQPKHARSRCRSTDRRNMELTHILTAYVIIHVWFGCALRKDALICIRSAKVQANHGTCDKKLTAVELFWWMLLTTFRCPNLGQTNLLVAVEFHYLTCQRDWTHNTHLKDFTNGLIYEVVILICYYTMFGRRANIAP